MKLPRKDTQGFENFTNIPEKKMHIGRKFVNVVYFSLKQGVKYCFMGVECMLKTMKHH